MYDSVLSVLLLQVPGALYILFNFTFFSIMDQVDMVELLDGYSNQVVVRFDGRNPPREIVNITADFVILYFYSDRTNQAQGFSMIYQGENQNWVEGQRFCYQRHTIMTCK